MILFSLAIVPALVLADGLSLPDPLGGRIPTFVDLIKAIVSYISTIIGTLAVLMFVIAGIMFVTSAGNSSKIDQAKKTAIYAAIGVAIALAGGGLIALVQLIITGEIK